MSDMSTTDLAWMAGIVEGEGCIRINKATGRTLGHLCVSVTSTDLDMLQPLQGWWGGYLKPASTRPGCKPAWSWVIAAQRAATFLRAIEPYCRVARIREKLLVALEFQDQKRLGVKDDEYREQQFAYYLWMRELNARGVDVA